MNVKPWNEDLKHLKEIILKKDKIEEAKDLFLSLHSKVHSQQMSGTGEKTFEDELWEGMDENKFKKGTNEKSRTVAYGIWHCTRIEDITMNILVNDSNQVLNTGSWKDKIGSTITDTGNTLNKEEILEFSKTINMEELRKYRIAVGRATRDIVTTLEAEDMKRRFSESQLQRIIDEGAVLDLEGSRWLIDFWGKKNVAGILLMPCTRHHMVHLNESLRAKKKG